MKKVFVRGMSLLLLLSLLGGCYSTRSYVKNSIMMKRIKRVAVLPFVCDNPDIGMNIASSLAARLVESDLVVLERLQLNKILQEQGLTMSGLLQDYNIAIGKMKGVDALIVGNALLSRGWGGVLYGGYVEFVSDATARVIDVETGEVLLAVSFHAEIPKTLTGVITPSQVGEKLAEKIIEAFHLKPSEDY